MGAFDPKGEAPPCDGEDILGQLNDVFGNPDSDRYKQAKSHNKFGTIPNAPRNYKALIDAYEYAGLTVIERWASYLRALGMVRSADPQQGPQNIYDIAQFRDRCLKNGLGMRTIIHQPHHGGHVHTLPGSGIDPEVVDSPFPLPEPKKSTRPSAKKKPSAKKNTKPSAKKKPPAKKSAKPAAKKKRPAKKSARPPAKKSRSKKRR